MSGLRARQFKDLGVYIDKLQVHTPGTAALRTTDNEVQLTPEEHKGHRRAVGKLQWMTYTRPDNCYATRELAGPLGTNHTHPTEVEIPVEVSTRNRELELHRNASIHSEQGWNTDRLLHRCGMSRMPSYKKIGNRICRTSHGMQWTQGHFGTRTQAATVVVSGTTEALRVQNFLLTRSRAITSIHTQT